MVKIFGPTPAHPLREATIETGMALGIGSLPPGGETFRSDTEYEDGLR